MHKKIVLWNIALQALISHNSSLQTALPCTLNNLKHWLRVNKIMNHLCKNKLKVFKPVFGSSFISNIHTSQYYVFLDKFGFFKPFQYCISRTIPKTGHFSGTFLGTKNTHISKYLIPLYIVPVSTKSSFNDPLELLQRHAPSANNRINLTIKPTEKLLHIRRKHYTLINTRNFKYSVKTRLT